MDDNNQTDRMLLLEVRNDVKSMSKDINEIKVLDAVQNKHLSDHMRRTELNERRLDKLETFKIYFAFIAVLMTVAIELFRRFL